MKTAAGFEGAFALYFEETDRCERNGCHWALFHILVAIPGVCASLEEPGQKSSVRSQLALQLPQGSPDCCPATATK